MAPVIGLLVIAGLCLVLAVLRRRRHAFPPVVELAQTARLPRLGFKIASLTAREPEHPASAPPTTRTTTPDVSRTPPPTEPQAPDEASIYETTSGPYGAAGVQGARIAMSDDGEGDLPIRFRSAHPNAIPIANAGELADQIRVGDMTGRITVGSDDASHTIAFNGPAD